MKMKKQYLIALLVVALGFGGYVFAQVSTGQLSACVSKNGETRLIITGFTKRNTCETGQQLVSWNIQGLKGDKGDKGDTGDIGPQGAPAQFGTSTIAFIGQNHARCDGSPFNPFNIMPNCRTVLKTDGSVWKWDYTGNSWFATGSTTPIAVSEIVYWEDYSILDKNGDIWFWDETVVGSDKWRNAGHP